MPWRGPSEPGEYPTLGYGIGEWIEGHCVIPDGYRQGDRYLLTDEMWRFLLRYYLIAFDDELAPDGLLWFYGGQLRRSQKWGKDPFGAAVLLAEALGPARFDGWDASGEPVGAPYPTPYMPCLGTSEEQTDNTYQPLLEMVRRGPLIDLPGMDAGETRIKLPSGGEIEPVTASARARLGQRMTFATLTETHLWTPPLYRRLAGAVKRNIAGMDGRWLELTNAWDPTEASEAQVTAETRNPRVYLNTVEPVRVDDLDDDDALYRELLRQYGDSAQERGGWVNIRGRIMHEVRSKAHFEADRRRFFLNEIVVGESVFVDPVRWDTKACRGETLDAGEVVALGFDGSKYRDATALVASRLSDGRLFTLQIWERPANAEDGWRVPSAKVDQKLRDVFDAYKVVVMFADPYRWQDYLDAWSALWPDRVVEFPTNSEQRMDKAIERFTTSFEDGQITHDGDATLSRHAKNAVVVKGSRRKPRPGESELLQTHYLKMAKRGDGFLIDAAVAAVLAHEARAHAIEHDMASQKTAEVWAVWQ
jgi:hypothetical protein